VDWIAQWQFDAVPADATEPPAGKLLLTTRWSMEQPLAFAEFTAPRFDKVRDAIYPERLGRLGLNGPVHSAGVLRFALPPFPAELGGQRRPRMAIFTILLDPNGEVAGVNLEKMPAAWHPYMESILNTWVFTPARLDGVAVPWLMGFEIDFPEPYPQAIRDAFQRNRVPAADTVAHPPRLLAEAPLPGRLTYLGRLPNRWLPPPANVRRAPGTHPGRTHAGSKVQWHSDK